MRSEDKDKRIAVLVSVAVHAAVFGVLAGAGVFTFIQEHSQAEPVDVTLYNEDAVRNLPQLGDGSSAGPTYAAPAAPVPAIDESYTDEVQAQREIQHIMAETGADARQAEQIAAAQHNGRAPAEGQKAASADAHRSSTGHGPGGLGTHSIPGGQGDGVPGGDGLQPASKARLVSVPNVDSYYPEDLRRKNISGTVVVHIVVAADGSVSSAAVAASSGYEAMDSAAVQIAYGCVYEPARNSYGQAVASERDLNIPFQIQ